MTWLETFHSRALLQPGRPACTFLEDGVAAKAGLTYGELDRDACRIASVLQSQAPAGERALLVYPPGLDYVTAFLGCLYAKIIGVPAYPPRLNHSIERLEAVIEDASPSVALTTTRMLSRFQKSSKPWAKMKALKWLTTDDVGLETATQFRGPAAADGGEIAFLQYTSGSTSVPKGVIVTHGSLTANQESLRHAFGQTEDSVVLSWLPLYHDMGLIGSLLHTFYVGARCILMSPTAFLQRPVSWLQAISEYRATTSGGPNFAYELCLRKIAPETCPEIDLSSWTVAFCGAEPVRPETLEGFASAFGRFGFRKEAFYPCYGLAESTLIVSGRRNAAEPIVKTFDGEVLAKGVVGVVDAASEAGRRLASCGQPAGDQQVVIVDPETLSSASGNAIGEIWVAGESVARGYWDHPVETAETFGAYLKDKHQGPFLRTGDLGFISEGELFVTGRLKDLIIIRGLNHYPQDIELTVEKAVQGVRAGCAAAFPVDVDGSERLVIVQELERTRLVDSSTLIAVIREALARGHELDPYAVVFIRAGSLPKTSSGKVQRAACKRLFLTDQLEVVSQWLAGNAAESEMDSVAAPPDPDSSHDIERWISELVAARLGTTPDQISPLQPLIAYGLDSLTALDLSHRCEIAIGKQVSASSILESHSIAELARELASGSGQASVSPQEEFPRPSGAAAYELSIGQQAIWFISELFPESAAYNLAAAMRISGEFDVGLFRLACQIVVDRHPALRSAILVKDGEILQLVQATHKLDLELEDAVNWDHVQLRRRLNSEARHRFDLLGGDPLRIRLFRKSRLEHVLTVVVHHIMVDFWSLAIMVREIGEAYLACQQGLLPALPAIEADYNQYVKWQQNFIRSSEGKRQADYWQSELNGLSPIMRLPTDRVRPTVQSYDASSVPIVLSEDLAGRLESLARQQGATLYVVLLAAFQILLHKYTGQKEVAVGTPGAGRGNRQWRSVVGYFINALVIRSRIAAGIGFDDILGATKKRVLGALNNQDYPFALIVDKLAPARDFSRSPLFQVMFALQKGSDRQDPGVGALALGEDGPAISMGGLNLECLKIDGRVGQFELTMMVAEYEGKLLGSLQYNLQLFDTVTVERMGRHYQALLESIVRTNGRGQATQLPILNDRELHQILAEWNGGQDCGEEERTIHQMFQAQVERTPDVEAVIYGGAILTYQELNSQSNRLATLLIEYGAVPDTVVAIHLERSIEMVVAILGILKSGAAYLPLDSASPAQRLTFMLEDAQAAILLTQNRLADFVGSGMVTKVALDEGMRPIPGEFETNVAVNVGGDNLAYVIYTSGSTGRPKGVMIAHHNVASCFRALDPCLGAQARGRWLAVTSASFDISVLELLWTLTRGYTTVIQPSQSNERNLEAVPDASIGNLILDHNITHLQCTPSLASVLAIEEKALTAMHGLQLLLVGGEALPIPLAGQLGNATRGRLNNMYGPTEATIWCSTEAIEDPNDGAPIGRPFESTAMYIFDDSLEAVPLGVSGEIYIAGQQVSRGYLNRPDMSAERFVPSLHSPVPGERMYRSGDLARYRSDGKIEFQRRRDDQIKLRGYRIEISEIESILSLHPDIARACVVLRGDGPDGRSLVAYFVLRFQPASHIPDTSMIRQLRQYLDSQLPAYMVPATFVRLEALPLMVNGKIDRARLPAPLSASAEGRPDVALPATPVEEAVAEVWRQVLPARRMGIDDSFFELGGNSLSATKAIALLRQTFPIEIPLRSLFTAPTIRGIAQIIDEELVESVQRLSEEEARQISSEFSG
jgi:amino acid adenylation domain-containing protein